VFLILAAIAISTSATAQSQSPLPITPIPSDSVSTLINALFEPSMPFNPNNEPLLSPDEYFRRQQDSKEGISIGIGTALASFPLGASSAGFAYSVDPATGAPQLKSVSFGGMYVDRAVTNGRGVLNLGGSYQHAAYDTLQGVDLKKDGFPVQSQLGVYVIPDLTPSATLPEPADVGDAWRATLDIKSDIFVFSGSYGLTNSLDIGWAIPFASLDVTGRLMRDYDAARDYDAFPTVPPLYPNRAGTLVQAEGATSASGVGDILVRGKYAFGTATRQIGFVIGELRLPTGDEENLLGAGKTSFRFLGGATKQFGSGSVNVNAGYTGGGLTDEINFAAGTEFGLLPRKQLTVSADFISQTLRDTVTSFDEFVSFDQTSPGPTVPLSRRVQVSYGFWNRGTTTLTRAAVGAKYHVGGNVLLTGSALFRLNDNGYQPKLVGLFGLEYTIVRK
jgi:hypothetical protein